MSRATVRANSARSHAANDSTQRTLFGISPSPPTPVLRAVANDAATVAPAEGVAVQPLVAAPDGMPTNTGNGHAPVSAVFGPLTPPRLANTGTHSQPSALPARMVAVEDAAPLVALAVLLVKLPMGALTLAVWAVLGLVVWLPLLARTMALFSLRVLFATVRGQRGPDGRALHAAAIFYLLGFSKIAAALLDPHGDEFASEFGNGAAAEVATGGKHHAALFALEMLYTITFWGVTAALLALLGF